MNVAWKGGARRAGALLPGFTFMKLLDKKIIDLFVTHVSDVRLDEPMSKHTTFRLGGLARLYAVATSSEQLLQAVEVALELEIPWVVIGGGTNILVADEGFEGVVIQAVHQTMQVEGALVTVESGAISALVARKTVEVGLTGFEWAVGLPGTLGGAMYGDAGCYGGEMRDAVTTVDVYDVARHERRQLTNKECRFDYRDSIFKHERFVILGCVLGFEQTTDVGASRAKMDAILQERKNEQPLGVSSAGCIFKNVDYQDEHLLDVLRSQVEVPVSMLAAKRLAAGWLIDQAGLKGLKIGDFRVSEKHGNFLLNAGHGRAHDVMELITQVKARVQEQFGIELHEEVQLLGF